RVVVKIKNAALAISINDQLPRAGADDRDVAAARQFRAVELDGIRTRNDRAGQLKDDRIRARMRWTVSERERVAQCGFARLGRIGERIDDDGGRRDARLQRFEQGHGSHGEKTAMLFYRIPRIHPAATMPATSCGTRAMLSGAPAAVTCKSR